MKRKLRKGLCGAISAALMLIMVTGVCFANDGLPVLQFEHDSYIGSPQSTITVGANVTDPDNSKPMKNVKVTFSLKDCNGNKTNLDSQKSDSNGQVACDVPLGDAFPYTLSGSASDGVNVTTVKITASAEEPATTEEEVTIELPDTDADDKAEKAEKKSILGSFSLLIITLITVVILAVVVIILVVKKNKNSGKNKGDKKKDKKKE